MTQREFLIENGMTTKARAARPRSSELIAQGIVFCKSRQGVFALVFTAAVMASCFKYTGLDVIGIDDSVYRTSLREWWHGRDPYAVSPAGNLAGTPFTYPPFALLVMSPLGLRSPTGVHNAMSFLTASCVVIASFTVAHAMARRVGTHGWWRWIAVSLVVGGALRSGNAVLSALSLGQVSVIIMTLCLVDMVLLRGTKASGVLIAVAAAVKVTPALFIVFLLVFARRAGIRSLVYAASFTTLTAILLPSTSWRYFTQYLWATDRVGNKAVNTNVSTMGVLARSAIGSTAQQWLWIVLSIVMVAVSLIAVRRAWNLDSGVWSAAIVGQLACLVSPITWSHYAAWFSLVGALLVIRALLLGGRDWITRCVLATIGTGIIYTLYFWALLWSLPEAPRDGVAGFLVQNVFFLSGLAGLVGLMVVALSSKRANADFQPGK